MRVFVTGASGFIGSAIVNELLGAGHRVLGLARSDRSADAIARAGAEVHRGDLDNVAGLRSAAAACDGVIHTAFVHDFSQMTKAGELDLRAIEAIGTALAGSDRPLIVTSGTALIAAAGIGTEDHDASPNSSGAHRVASERATLALAARGVHSAVLRLPPSVHGEGDYGFVPTLIDIARRHRASAYVDDGANAWAGVHRLDAAVLYRLILENGGAGARYHGVADEAVPTRKIAEVIGRRLGVPTISVARDDADAHFGWMARFFGADTSASSAKTRDELRWTPRHPGLLDDIDSAAYFSGSAENARWSVGAGDARRDDGSSEISTNAA
jgi:nucleoside-diphosphate-sugar epimerase